jgi:hypothetical protein
MHYKESVGQNEIIFMRLTRSLPARLFIDAVKRYWLDQARWLYACAF